MKTTRSVLATLFALAFALTGAAAFGEISCDTEDYRGVYAFYTAGDLIDLPPEGAALVGHFAQAGTFNPDGDGYIYIESTASYNGLVLPAVDDGSYTITPNCEVTFNVILPFPLGVSSVFEAALGHSNTRKSVMITDPPGTVVVGRHVRQDKNFCSNRDFRGGYQIDIGGTTKAANGSVGPFHMLGRLESDGDGHFTVKAWANYGTHVVQKEFSGTYEVTGRCFVTLTYHSNVGADWVISGALGGRGESAMVMVTTDGWSVSGELRGQQ